MGFFERIFAFLFGVREKKHIKTGNNREESYKQVKRTNPFAILRIKCEKSRRKRQNVNFFPCNIVLKTLAQRIL